MDYIKDYVKNYQAVMPVAEDAEYECFEHSHDNNLAKLKTGKTISSCTSEENPYVMAVNTKPIAMTTMGLNEINKKHKEKLLSILNMNKSEEDEDVLYSTDALKIENYNINEVKTEIERIKIENEETLKTYYGAYGIDPNLIVAMMYASEKNNIGFYIWDDHARSGEEYDVKNMSNQRNKEHWIEKHRLLSDQAGSEGVYAEHVIEYMEIKMQVLMEEYKGNVLLALADYC